MSYGEITSTFPMLCAWWRPRWAGKCQNALLFGLQKKLAGWRESSTCLTRTSELSNDLAVATHGELICVEELFPKCRNPWWRTKGFGPSGRWIEYAPWVSEMFGGRFPRWWSVSPGKGTAIRVR